MKRIIQAAAVSLFLGVAAQAQQADIQGTIDQQFEAFRADDFATAFTFASPDLQRLFGSSDNFGRMVTQSYPMVWRPADVRYLELSEDGGLYRQKVRITDQNGGYHILEYSLMQTDAGWRIFGVQILDVPGASV